MYAPSCMRRKSHVCVVVTSTVGVLSFLLDNYELSVERREDLLSRASNCNTGGRRPVTADGGVRSNRGED